MSASTTAAASLALWFGLRSSDCWIAAARYSSSARYRAACENIYPGLPMWFILIALTFLLLSRICSRRRSI